jgi:hypothetical protein
MAGRSLIQVMRRHALILGLTFLGLAGFAVFAGWAVFAASHMGGSWSASLGPIWPYVLGGVVVTAVLGGALMWLAFYSANHGYDDQVDHDAR